MAETLPQGVLARFRSPESLLDAVHAAKRADMRGVEAFTPFPVDEVTEALDLHDKRIPWLGLIGGIFGFVAAYAMQIATNLDYPLDIGGRPLIAWQAFALIGFELTVLFSVLFMVVGFFLFNRLPRYHHALFDVPGFEHVTRDGFFLFIPAADPDALESARALLAPLDPISVDKVAQ